MSTLRFNLRVDKPDKFSKCPVELIYQVSGQRKYYQLKDTKLNPINWDAANQSAIYVNPTNAKKLLSIELRRIVDTVILFEDEVNTVNDNISAVKSQIKDIEKRFELDTIPYSVSMVVDTLKSKSNGKTKKEEHRDYLFEFIDDYIANHASTREKGSLGVYRAVKNHLQAFQDETRYKVRFETIDYAFFQRFQTFLINRVKIDSEGNKSPQLNNTTIAKALSTLKTFLGYARKSGIKVNESYKDYSIKREKLEVIALDEEEFARLLKVDLDDNKRLDQVRDIFCFSCSTGLRVSDMEQLKRENIKLEEIILNIKKTKTELRVPLNKVSSEILFKYKHQLRPLPMISSQKLNVYIKELCKKAKIDDPIEIVRFRGSKRETTTYPKYELIHLHTGRKTFCTLSLERGMSAEQVMEMSGHSDYKSFKRYVNITEKLKKVVMVDHWGAPVTHLKVV